MKTNQRGNTSIAIVIAGLLISIAIGAVAVKLDKIGEANNLLSKNLEMVFKQKVGAGIARKSLVDQPSGPNYNLSAVTTSYENDFVLGNVNAPYSLIVYSDFQCPFCSKFFPTAKDFAVNSSGEVNLVLRHFPLDFHQIADDLSIMAECIGKVSSPAAFWNFTEFAYKAGNIQNTESLLTGFKKAYNMESLNIKICRESSGIKAKVDQHISEAKAIGITGTPTSILVNNKSKNSKLMMGIKPINALKQILSGM